jgi:hypothetical protein
VLTLLHVGDEPSDVPLVTRLVQCRSRVSGVAVSGVAADLTGPLDVPGSVAHLHAPEPRLPVPGPVAMAGSAA